MASTLENFDTVQASATREQLLNTAESLFLQHGLDDVSLRKIVREAGQRNQSALQYHFGNRDGLIAAILGRRMDQLEERRSKLVDELLRANEQPEVRDVCATLVRAPFILCRENSDFKAFLGRFGQRVLSSSNSIMFAVDNQALPSLEQMRNILRTHLAHLAPEILRLRAENAFGLTFLSISRRALANDTFSGRNAELFYNNLVDQVAGMLMAPVSLDTRTHLTSTDKTNKAAT